jgi:hypothetical protein
MRRRRRRQHQHIADRKQVVESIVVAGIRLELGCKTTAVVVVDLHIKAADAAPNRATDAAHAQNADAVAGQFDADQLSRGPARPVASIEQSRTFVRAPRRTKHQQNCHFRYRVAQHVRR